MVPHRVQCMLGVMTRSWIDTQVVEVFLCHNHHGSPSDQCNTVEYGKMHINGTSQKFMLHCYCDRFILGKRQFQAH